MRDSHGIEKFYSDIGKRIINTGKQVDREANVPEIRDNQSKEFGRYAAKQECKSGSMGKLLG